MGAALNWWFVWVFVAAFFLIFIRGSNMAIVDITALQKEVEDELREEENKKAKAALKQNARDIAAAKLVLANLERKKLDLIAAIGDGTL